MLFDDDLMGQAPTDSVAVRRAGYDGIVSIRAGEKPVPELFEYRLSATGGSGERWIWRTWRISSRDQVRPTALQSGG